MTDVDAALLIVVRTDKSPPDRLRKYTVLIDGKAAGHVGRGQSVQAEVPPGRHEVRLKIDWCGSPSVWVEATPGGRIQLAAEPTGGFQGFIAMVARPRSYLKLWLTAE
jgi:hypothetical protein